METQRWIIARRLILVLTLGTGVALAARRARKGAAPPEEPTPANPAPEQPPAPSIPQAPPLFPTPLPLPALDVPAGLPSNSAQACNACHWQIHDQWRASPHAAAWNAPAFRAALDQIGDPTVCLSCHLPLANQHPRLAVGYVEGDIARPDLQPNPAWDPTLMSEGVTCAVCHVRDGAIVTARPGASAPHPLSVSDELSSSELCATCHQLTWPGADLPFYDTYGEWQRSAYADAGIGCQDCHMPPLAGPATATRFAATASHRFSADPARALSILVHISAPEIQRGSPLDVVLTVQNTGAGHSVPTGSPFKAYRIVLTLRGADGKQITAPHSTDLARVVDNAPPWTTRSDTRLPAGGQIVIKHTFTVDQRKHAGPGMLDVAIYRLDAKAMANRRWSPDRAPKPLIRQQIPLAIL